MKNHTIYLGSFILAASMLFSCDKFLEEDPRNILSPDNFFNSDIELRAAVNGVYATLYTDALYNKYGINHMLMYGADDIEPTRAGEGNLNDISNYTLSESRDAFGREVWISLYKMIQDANIALSKLEDNEQISDQYKNQSRGELLFLRAFAYYNLTNIFGDVPYYRTDLGIDEVQQLERHNKDLIREDLVSDLQIAQDLLPVGYSASELGRVTKWAAATLTVKILLIQHDWTAARDKSVEIITGSSHALLDNYEDVFDPMNTYNDELIWCIDFVRDINPQGYTSIFVPRLADEPKISSQKSALRAALEARNEGFTGNGMASPMCGFVEDFPVNDLRRPLNIIESYLGFELNYPYMPKLWNLDQVNSPRNNHGDNFIVFRLADVYLMAAEAENEVNGPDEAYQYINKVRERAYSPHQPLSGLNQQQFRQAIYDERRWELAGEFHRRMDLIRWGILVDVVKNTKTCTYNPAANIMPHHVLFPIPEEEILLNPNLLTTDPTNNGYR